MNVNTKFYSGCDQLRLIVLTALKISHFLLLATKHFWHNILGGAARNLRCRLSTSSSTGMLSRPHRCPRRVGAILTHTSLFPDALTLSSRLASRESLQKWRKSGKCVSFCNAEIKSNMLGFMDEAPFCGAVLPNLSSDELDCEHLRIFCIADQSEHLHKDKMQPKHLFMINIIFIYTVMFWEIHTCTNIQI